MFYRVGVKIKRYLFEWGINKIDKGDCEMIFRVMVFFSSMCYIVNKKFKLILNSYDIMLGFGWVFYK